MQPTSCCTFLACSLSLNGGIILSLDLGHINSAGWNALSGFLTLMLAATFFISGYAP